MKEKECVVKDPVGSVGRALPCLKELPEALSKEVVRTRVEKQYEDVPPTEDGKQECCVTEGLLDLEEGWIEDSGASGFGL